MQWRMYGANVFSTHFGFRVLPPSLYWIRPALPASAHFAVGSAGLLCSCLGFRVLPPHTLLSVLQGVFAQLHPRPRERDVPRRDRGLLQGCVRQQLRGGWGVGEDLVGVFLRGADAKVSETADLGRIWVGSG